MKKWIFLLFPLLFLKPLFSEEALAVVTFVQGKVSLIREQKSRPLRPATILYRFDRIVTENGKAELQVGPHAVLRLSPGSVLDLSELTEELNRRKISLDLQNGTIYAKIVKKEKDSIYQIKTPTTVAGVRGTEFIVAEERKPEHQKLEDGDIPPGVFVNSGEVEVDFPQKKLKEPIIVASGEQVLTRTEEIKKQILEDFMKKKMDIFAKLQLMKEENYERLKKQKEKDFENMQKIKQMQKDNLQKMKGN